MKKIISLVLYLCLLLAVLSGCEMDVALKEGVPAKSGQTDNSGSKSSSEKDDNTFSGSKDNGGDNNAGNSGESSKDKTKYTWPKDLMGDIPAIKGDEYINQLIGDPNSTNGIVIGYDNVGKEEYSEYVDRLKNLGYETVLNSEAGVIFNFEGSKGGYFIALQLMIINDDGTGALIISHGKNS